MDKDFINSKIKTNVYQITFDSKVALHKHQNFDEVFYCIKGSGFGILENEEIELSVGNVFVVKENTLHALRSESEMWVSSFLIPVID